MLLIPTAVCAELKRPNIVLIYTDDQGYGDASCLNPEAKFETPNMDRLAREGIAFTDAHCSDTVCTPSRYGLLTGRYSWRTTLKSGVMGAEGKCLIANERLTIASFLKQQGYATAMVGKWHLGMDFPGTNYRNRDWTQPVRDMPLDKGFDYFFGVPASLNYGVLAWFEGRDAKTPPTRFTAKKPNDRHLDYRIMPPYEASPEETRSVVGTLGMEVAEDFIDNQCLTRFTDKAIDWMQTWLNSGDPKPFFLYLPLTSPHYPVCPLPEFHGKGAAGGYGEFVIETDFHIGRILKFLDEMQIANDTLVILTSDNGPESSWEQRVAEFGHHSNGIFKEGKRSIYEGGHRVPFFVRWPAGISASGQRCESPICQTDILATLADILRVELPENAGEDSYSFYAAFETPARAMARPPLVHHAANGRFAVRSNSWKLIMPHGKNAKELYDLAADPRESQDCLQAHPEVAGQLERELTRIVLSGRSTMGPPQANDTGHWSDLTWITPAQFSGDN